MIFIVVLGLGSSVRKNEVAVSVLSFEISPPLIG